METPNEVAAVSDPPLMIRPEDKCDPESLKTKPEVSTPTVWRSSDFIVVLIPGLQLKQATGENLKVNR